MSRPVRIGVVADSHVGEALAELPPAVFDALAGVDLILHAGDITEPAVLRRLERIAPVLAVQGDHDRAAGLVLPRARVVRVGRHRIGLTHGRRNRYVELAAAALTMLTGRLWLLGFHAAMRRRFGDVDCIVHGHLHLPVNRVAGGVRFFSPGAVYNAELDPFYDDSGLAAKAYLRFRRGLTASERAPAVGLIEVDDAGLRATALPIAVPTPLPA